MAKDPNEKINKKIKKLAERKADLLKDKFKTNDKELRKVWDKDIRKIDAEILDLKMKLK